MGSKGGKGGSSSSMGGIVGEASEDDSFSDSIAEFGLFVIHPYSDNEVYEAMNFLVKPATAHALKALRGVTVCLR